MAARVNPILMAFNGGETSPLLDGRIDNEGYFRSCAQLFNMIPLQQGPATKRPGSKFIAEIKNSLDKSRLIEFEYSSGDAYILELGDYYMRFYTFGAQVQGNGSPYEIATPWAKADLALLKYRESADVIYFDHPDYAPYKLTRYGATSWTLAEVVFDWPPFLTKNDTNISVIASAKTGSITLKSGPDPVTNGDFTTDISGWSDVSDGGGSIAHDAGDLRMQITGDGISDYGHAEQQVSVEPSTLYSLTFDVFDAALEVLVGTATKGGQLVAAVSKDPAANIEVTFTTGATDTSIYIGFRNLSASTSELDNVELAPWLFHTDHIDAHWKYVTDDYLTADMDAVDETVGPMVFDRGEKLVISLSGTWVATVMLQRKYGVDGDWLDYIAWTTNATLEITSLENDVYYQLKMTARTSGLCSGKLSQPEQAGYGKITVVTNGHNCTMTVIDDLPSTDATKKWSEGAFSDYRGYPRALSFYEQRLIFAGTYYRPSTVYGSKVDDYQNHETGSTDEYAYSYTLAGARVEQIIWLMDASIMHIGSAGDEWKFGFVDEPTTNTNVDAKRQSDSGSEDIQAMMIGDVVIFIEDGGRHIRAIRYNLDTDRYQAPRFSEHAEHLFRQYTITAWAFAAKPTPVIWMVRSDGKLISCTFDLVNKIAAYAVHELAGAIVESVATIRGSDRDEVWIICQRTIDSLTKRYIEQFQTPLWSDKQDAFYVDCGLTYTGEATDSISGLDHLKGETVKILANGAVHAERVVSSGGVITLQYETTKAHIGLGYQGRLKTKRLEVKTGAGTSQGKKKTVYKVVARLFQSMNIKLSGDENDLDRGYFRTTHTPAGYPPELFTGDIEIPYKTRNDNDAYIVVANDDPVPFTVVALMPTLYTSDL